METISRYASIWWNALVHPEQSGRLVIGTEAGARFDWFILAASAVLYAFYGLSMGLFHSFASGLVSCVKMPFLFLLSLAVCFYPLYVLNCVLGPRLSVRQTVRLLLVAISANAAALGSYGPVSLFFTLTAFDKDYHFLIIMHVVVFGFAGIASLFVIALAFRAAAAELRKPLRPVFIIAWGLLYAFVGTQMSWVLRPWVGCKGVPYTFFRTVGGSFIEAVWRVMHNF
jgi:hypothetical protein